MIEYHLVQYVHVQYKLYIFIYIYIIYLFICLHVLQVETVFHEFGHALQHMLTKQGEGLVSGIRGIEWDAVELPSQFMENWCYHRHFSNKRLIFNRH